MRALAWTTAVLLLLFALVMTLPFSAQGTRLLVSWVNQLGSLQVEYGGGSLFGELQLRRAHLQLDAVDLQIDGLDTSLELGCFWRSTFCFRHLRAQSLRLEVSAAASDDGDVQASEEPEALEIPFAYKTSQLEIGQLDIRWPGGQWQQQALQADIELVNSELYVASARLASPRLELDASPEPSAGYLGFAPTSIYMPLAMSLELVELVDAQFTQGETQQALSHIGLSGAWRGYDLSVSGLDLVHANFGQASIRGEIAFNENWPLALQAQFSLALPEQTLLAGRQAQLVLGGDLAALESTLHSPGEPELNMQLEADLTARDLPLAGQLSLELPEGESLASFIGAEGGLSQLVLQGPVSAQFEGSLYRQALFVGARASGLGYEQLAVDAAGLWTGSSLDIQRVSLADAVSDSQLDASGQLSWGDGLQLQADIQSPGWSLPDAGGELAGAVTLSLLASEDLWTLKWHELDVSGEVQGLPAFAAGNGGLDNRFQLLPGLTEIDINGASLLLQAGEGRGELASLNFSLDDLGRWMPGARGSIRLSGDGTLGREQLQLQGEARQIYLQGMAVEQAQLQLNYRGADQQFNLLVQVPKLESAGYEFRNFVLDLAGNPAAHRLRLSSEGAVDGHLVVKGQWASQQWDGKMQPTRLATESGDWVLDEAVPIAWSGEGGELTLAQHCWRHSEFNLCAEPVTLGRQGDIDMRLAGDIRAFNGLLPRGLRVRGQLDASLKAAWQEDSGPQLILEMNARDVRTTRRYGMGERVSVQWQAIDVSLTRKADRSLSIIGAAQRENRQVLSMDVRLPTGPEGALSGHVGFDRLRLATLSPWLTQLSDLEGALSGELVLSGTPQDPLAHGELQLAEGRIVAVANPTVLSDMELDLRVLGDRAELAGLANLGGGELALQGSIVGKPELRIELTVSGERHQILLPPASEFLVAEELSLVITESLLDVRGEVRVLEGVLRHEELPEGSVGLSREVVVVDTQGRVIEEGRPFDINADVWVHIRDRFQVQGEGLRATLGGDLHVLAQPGEDPQVFGNLNLAGGELEVYRQRLQIARGTIAFSGPADNPELNIAAEREIRSDDVTVGARLLGRLDEPVLEVYSDPVMPQGEAMSYLVRGRGLDSGAGADGTALALSMGADVVNRSGIVSEINRLPLISDVSFGASGAEDDTAATVSGYIGNRLYLSFGRGLYQPINVLTARLYLQSRLWLEVVSELENSADLYYSFDIN